MGYYAKKKLVYRDISKNLKKNILHHIINYRSYIFYLRLWVQKYLIYKISAFDNTDESIYYVPTYI